MKERDGDGIVGVDQKEIPSNEIISAIDTVKEEILYELLHGRNLTPERVCEVLNTLKDTLMGKVPESPEEKQISWAFKSLADENAESQFQNRGYKNIARTIWNIFRTSEKTVKIFTHSLNNKVTEQDEYCDNLFFFLVKGGNVKIIYNKKDENNSRFMEILKRFSTQITLYKIDPKKINICEENFTIGDTSKYCCEANNEEEIFSWSFNTPDIVKLFNKHFQEYLSNATPTPSTSL